MIIVFKTFSGQEVICTYDEEADLCSKARIIHPMPQENGKVGLALIPYFMSNQDTSFELPPGTYTHIIESVPKEIEDYYLSQTSGLIMGGTL